MDKVMKWIRLWCERLTSPRSGTWQELGEAWELYTKLMCIAGTCEQHGIISVPGTELGYSDGQLAAMCRMPQGRFDAQLKHLLSLPDKVKRLSQDRLEMVAWADFQTPYDKQIEKGYKERLRPKVTPEGYATDDKKIRCSEEKKSEDKRERPQPSADGLALARFLHESLVRVLPGIPESKLGGKELERRLESWAVQFDQYGRVDRVTVADYRAIIAWALADDFWRQNVHSPGALRTRKKDHDAKVWVDFRTRGGRQTEEAGRIADLRRRAEKCSRTSDCSGAGREPCCAYCPRTMAGSKR